MNIRDIVEKIPLFTNASSSSKTKIITYAVTKKYKKGEYLFHVRDTVERIYIVVSGYAVLERVNRNNVKRAIFLLGKDAILNEVILEKANSSINCYALSDLEVVSFSRQQFLEIMSSDFDFTKSVIGEMSLKIRKLYHQVENTTKMTKLDKQIASRLWKLGRDYGIDKGEYIELPFDLTITFLSDFVGSNRETVSRIVKNMANEHILTIKNGRCVIYDIAALHEISKK